MYGGAPTDRLVYIHIYVLHIEKVGRQIDRETEMEIETEIAMETERDRERQTDRQTGRQTDRRRAGRQRDRHTQGRREELSFREAACCSRVQGVQPARAGNILVDHPLVASNITRQRFPLILTFIFHKKLERCSVLSYC